MSFLHTPPRCWAYWTLLLLSGGVIYIRNRKTKKTPSDEKTIAPPRDPEEVYKELAKKKWLKSYQGGTTLSYNQNVDSLFYDRKAYELKMLAPNEVETLWKQRILMESTPRGLIIMYFNAYKRGFSYFSDQSIPYSLINAVAMKYVLLYFCRDFFIDEIETMDLILSPLIDLYEKDAFQKKPAMTVENGGKKPIDVKSGPFLKSKNFVQKNQLQAGSGSGTGVISNVFNGAPSSEPVKEYVKNRFIYEGKICNFSLLQKYNVLPVQSKKKIQPMKYSDFKQWRNPQTPTNDSSVVRSIFCQQL